MLGGWNDPFVAVDARVVGGEKSVALAMPGESFVRWWSCYCVMICCCASAVL